MADQAGCRHDEHAIRPDGRWGRWLPDSPTDDEWEPCIDQRAEVIRHEMLLSRNRDAWEVGCTCGWDCSDRNDEPEPAMDAWEHHADSEGVAP